MRLRLVVVVLVTVISSIAILPASVGVATSPVAPVPPSTDLVVDQMKSIPIPFTKNEGQWDEQVLFRTSAGSATIWFCRDGITYHFTHLVPSPDGNRPAGMISDSWRGPEVLDRAQDSVEMVVVKAKFVDPNPGFEVKATGLLNYKYNFFLGNDRAKWRSDVPNYSEIVFEDLHSGLDLRFESKDGVVACSYSNDSDSTRAVPEFRYESTARVIEDGPGRFRVETPWRTVAPFPSLPSTSGTGANHLDNKQVTITPGSIASPVSMIYSSYLGGNYYDRASDIAVDSTGAAYIVGETWSADFPVPHPPAQFDVFLLKLRADGAEPVFGTYWGSSESDFAYGMAIDSTGAAFVTGYAYGYDYPVTPGAYSENGSFDRGFVTKVSATGSSLAYSTFSDSSSGMAIAVDRFGCAFITGTGGAGASVSKFNSNGSNQDFFVSFGGVDGYASYGRGIAVDAAGSIYVTGGTGSSDFPTVNGFQPSYGGGLDDGFIAKMTGSGSTIYRSYLGGNDLDAGYDISVDGSGNAYVTGLTSSTDFPVSTNCYQGTHSGSYDAFVTKINAAGTAPVYSTYLGGNYWDVAYRIAVDQAGSVAITGTTFSSNFPLVDAYQTSLPGGCCNNNYDLFVTKLSPSGAYPTFSTYLGGATDEAATGIAFDRLGDIYVAGETGSADFPITINAYQPSLGGAGDAFVTKFREGFPGEKQQLITDILSIERPYYGSEKPFFQTQETEAGQYLEYVKTQYDAGQVDPKDMEALARLVLSERVTKRALVDAVQISDYGAQGLRSIGVSLGMKAAFSWIGKAVKSVPGFGSRASSLMERLANRIEGSIQRLMMAASNGFKAPGGQLTFDQYLSGKLKTETALATSARMVTKELVTRLDQEEYDGAFFDFVENWFQDNVYLSLLEISASDKQSEAVNRAINWDYPENQFELAEADATSTLNTMIESNNWSLSAERFANTTAEYGTGTVVIGLVVLFIAGVIGTLFSGGITLLAAMASAGALMITYGTWISNVSALSESMIAAIHVNVEIPYVHLNPSVDKAFGPDVAPAGSQVDLVDMPTYVGRVPRTTATAAEFIGFCTNLRARVLSEDSTWATTGLDSLVMYDSLAREAEGLAIVDLFAAGSAGASQISMYDSMVTTYVLAGAAREALTGGLEISAFVYREGYRDSSVSQNAVNALDTNIAIVSAGEIIKTAAYDSLQAHSILIPPAVGINAVRGTLVGPGIIDLTLTIVNYGASTASDVIVFPVLPLDSGMIVGHTSDTVNIAPFDSAEVVFEVEVYDSLLAGLVTAVAGIPTPNYYILPPRSFLLSFEALCSCDCHGNPVCDAAVCDVLDVVSAVAVAFRNGAAVPDPNAACPYETTDVDCSTFTDVIDVVKIVAVAFRNGDPATEFCNPCP